MANYLILQGKRLMKLEEREIARAVTLCRQEGIDYTLNAEGDLVLEPPLKGKKIFFRPLPGLKAEVALLMENLKGRLQGQGAQVISCPVMPGDEELLRFRTGDVLLLWASYSQDLPVTVRFFSSPRRKGESLRLIACLTEALLQSPAAFTYTLASTWEHFKNFTYRRNLAKPEIAAALLEWVPRNVRGKENDLAQTLMWGLNCYFIRPLSPEKKGRIEMLIKSLSLPQQMPQEREGREGEIKTAAFSPPNPFTLPEGPIFVFQRPGQCPAKKLDNQDLEKLRQLLKTMGKNGDSPSGK